jgi:Predicted membrane-bound metal-dependent hydrolases
MNTSNSLLAHRGFTHSFLFVAIVAVFFSLIAERWHRPHNISFKRWLLFFGGVIFIHVFIDAFNNYGVGWFEPFSHQRFLLIQFMLLILFSQYGRSSRVFAYYFKT